MKKHLIFVLLFIPFMGTMAQSGQWKAYQDITKKFRSDMTPCEKMEIYTQIDSLFGGHIPIYMAEFNYMDNAIKCGDTATFKKMAYRIVRWKGWNPSIFEVYDRYKFLKKCDYWPEIDSIQQIHGNKKNYQYMVTLFEMEDRDQAARHAFEDTSLTQVQEDSLAQRMHEVDSANQEKLKWLIDTLGFPTWERVGSAGTNSAWLIAQHAPIPYLYEFAKTYQKAVADTNAEITNLAFLEDRSRSWRGLPQLYGTQFTSNAKNNKTVCSIPIADIKNVNYRRENMHLGSLEDYLESYTESNVEHGVLDKDSPIAPFDDDYVSYYYNGSENSTQPIESQEGITDAIVHMSENDYCKAISIFCTNCSSRYPFIQDLKRYIVSLLNTDCFRDKRLFISTYEVLERMALCGYEPDSFLDSLPDSLSAPFRANYPQLRTEYLRYLNHEDDKELLSSLQNRNAFEKLLQSGKNYHRYELDAWNHAYPYLLKMTEQLTKHDYRDFFKLLWREVIRGNIHAEDYATLYDHTYFRLYGKDYYGTLANKDRSITTTKPKHLDQHRQEICLPPIKKAVNHNSLTEIQDK
ncbi:MAG: hypothetical protein KBT45_06640 [Bacteroidales bacterium]|nr:hypothetical protein [Candidatus Colimorpha pelethequi]